MADTLGDRIRAMRDARRAQQTESAKFAGAQDDMGAQIAALHARIDQLVKDNKLK